MIERKKHIKDFVSRKIFAFGNRCHTDSVGNSFFWIKSSSDISVKDAEKQIEENLRAAGVSEYEKIDLQAYEKQAGVDLSKYVSYRFYTSDDLKIEAFLTQPIHKRKLILVKEEFDASSSGGANEKNGELHQYRQPRSCIQLDTCVVRVSKNWFVVVGTCQK